MVAVVLVVVGPLVVVDEVVLVVVVGLEVCNSQSTSPRRIRQYELYSL